MAQIISPTKAAPCVVHHFEPDTRACRCGVTMKDYVMANGPRHKPDPRRKKRERRIARRRKAARERWLGRAKESAGAIALGVWFVAIAWGMR
jgi:hypothetical protein